MIGTCAQVRKAGEGESLFLINPLNLGFPKIISFAGLSELSHQKI
jgi:hypothetical protein